MGKFGIGARVRDEDGDEGVIVGKRKGERQVKYNGIVGDRSWLNGECFWWSKATLTPIAANDDESAEREPLFKVGDRVKLIDGEGDGRPAGSVGTVKEIWGSNNGATVQFDAPFKGWGDCGRCWNVPWGFLAAAEWQPKVGDRVRVVKHRNWFGDVLNYIEPGSEVELTGLLDDGDFEVPEGETWTAFTTNTQYWIRSDDLEPLPVAAEAQGAGELQLAEGKFYRDAEGCKIGPMRNFDFVLDGYAWDCAGSNGYWNDHGKSQFGSDPDLVAEWVDEPAVLKKSDLVTLARPAMVTGFDPHNRDFVHVVLGTGGAYTLPRAALQVA